MAQRLKRRGIERECVVPYLILREYGFGVYGPRKSKSSLSAGIGQQKVYRSHECDGRRADGGGLDLKSSDEVANGSLSDSVRSTVATPDNLITRWVAYLCSSVVSTSFSSDKMILIGWPKANELVICM